jgi:hypothetical protein
MLLRGGMAAVPVVMTIASKPVMAQSMRGRCATASAFGSINASRPANVTRCGGHDPDYWRGSQHFNQWPSGFVPTSTPNGQRATQFEDCFPHSQSYRGQSLLQVLSTTSQGRDEIARLCVAALLNSVKGLTPAHVLGPTIVRDVWTSFARRGYYEPTAGVRWYADDSAPAGSGGISEWLRSTMPR